MYLTGFGLSLATILGLASALIVRRIWLVSAQWTPWEAMIVNLDIIQFTGNNKFETKVNTLLPDRFKSPEKIICKYQYTVDGTRYEANTVTPVNFVGGLRLPNYDSSLYLVLKLANGTNEPVPIILDPTNPRRSMISRIVPWKQFVAAPLLGPIIIFLVLWMEVDNTDTPFLLPVILVSAVITAVAYSHYQRKLEKNGRFLAKLIG